MLTNSDLYLAIGRLAKAHEGSVRGLRDYLHVLFEEVCSFAQSDAIPHAQFLASLDAAFEREPSGPAPVPTGELQTRGTFSAIAETLARQIAELEELQQTGRLDDPHRYYGIDTKSGSRWYNFTPSAYLEAGAAGAIGGWCPQDAPLTGRVLVPGDVAYTSENGTVETAPASELADEEHPLERVDWNLLEDFLCDGRDYE